MRSILAVLILVTFTLSAYAEVNDGLVASWSFDNDTHKKVFDASSYQNHGESKDVTYKEGVVGKAAYFNGDTSKIIVTDAPKSITNLKVGSISCWLKFENKGGQVLPILYLGRSTPGGQPANSMIVEVGHDRGNPYNRRLYLTTIVGRGANFCVDSRTNLEENVWYHYVAVVSEEGNTIYINGEEHHNRRYNLGSNATYTTFFNDVPDKDLLSIGYGKYSQEDPFYSFKGYIDEMKIYDRPLSAKEIKALYEVR
ncbi:MAG: LamG domain-containing protein [Rikenellaceae bacterium]